MPRRVAIVGSRLYRGGVRRHFRRRSAPRCDLVYRQPLPLRGFDQRHARGAGRGAGRPGHRAASRLPAASAGGRRRRKRADLRRGKTLTHRSGVFRHRPRARRRPISGWTRPACARTRTARCIVDEHLRTTPAAYLRDRRRDRPAEPDAGRHRGGPRSGRHAVRQASARHLAATMCRRRCSPPRRSRPSG